MHINEGTFPIKWVWPDQVPGLFQAARKLVEMGGQAYPPAVP